MQKTKIEWTHRPGTVGMTWNPIRARLKSTGKVGWACTHASPGCMHCYAESINKRWGTGLPFNVPSLELIAFFVDEKILEQPSKLKTPATIFVGDMFDLFHESISDADIFCVFSAMRRCPEHVFQVLTKRADRLQRFIAFWSRTSAPEPNIWLGVSVENQKYANERIPLLLQTPAAIRFLSVEPMLASVDLTSLPSVSGIGHYLNALSVDGVDPGATIPTKIDWVICGGESGFGARPFNLGWADFLRDQCLSAGVKFFMKQIGSNPEWPNHFWSALQPPKIKDHKGGDPAEWPDALRVREFPA